jgi:hypothetical protein
MISVVVETDVTPDHVVVPRMSCPPDIILRLIRVVPGGVSLQPASTFQSRTGVELALRDPQAASQSSKASRPYRWSLTADPID